MNLVGLIIAILALSYILSKATDMLVSGITQLSQGTNLEKGGFTALFVAMATSLPELFVSVSGALVGEANLGLSVAVGSNITNISMVLGGAAVLAGSLKSSRDVYRREIVFSFLIGSLPLLLLLDRSLSRIDGAVLLTVYIFYAVMTLTGKKRGQLSDVKEEYYEDHDLRHRILRFIGKKDVEQGLARFLVGSVALVVAANFIVFLGERLATLLNAPLWMIGLFMISVGTSLPELAFEIKTVAKKEYSMAFGNVIGSTIVNSTLVIGAAALFAPFKMSPATSQSYFISVIAFVVISTVFWLVTYTRRRLERWEGGLLVALYAVFVLVQVMFVQN